MSYKQAEQTLLMYQIDRIEYLTKDLDEDVRREINDRLSAISNVELAWGSAIAMDYGVYKKIISREQADELSKSIGNHWSPMTSNFYELHRDNISVESFEDTGLPSEINPYIDKNNTITLYPIKEDIDFTLKNKDSDKIYCKDCDNFVSCSSSYKGRFDFYLCGGYKEFKDGE